MQTVQTLSCNALHGNMSDTIHCHASDSNSCGKLHRKHCTREHYAKLDNTSLSSNTAHDTHAWGNPHEFMCCPILDTELVHAVLWTVP